MGRLGNSRAPGRMDFWSDVHDLFFITTVATTQLFSETVTVAGLPPGAVIYRVLAMIKSRTISDDSGSNNRLFVPAAPKHIQVRKVASTFVDAIQLFDNSMRVNASDEQPGIDLIGDIDIKAEVDGEATYEFQWEDSDADFGNLVFKDLLLGLRVHFTT